MPSVTADTGKKEKKTRRRLRLSCVECTKRRQRCDRVYPCGLCVSRGVSHLCRWENVPVARPTPARPPVIPSSGSDACIQQLSARIASLEQTVVAERQRNLASRSSSNNLDAISGSSPHSSSRGLSLPNDYSPHNSVVSLQSPSSGNSPYSSSPEPYSQDDEAERIVASALSDSVYSTVSSLTHQSIAHRGEYIGGGGSSLSALYSISSKETPRVQYASSTETSALFPAVSPNEHPCPTILRLTQSLPPSATVATLCQLFFRDANWRYGIPEQWFHATCTDMWNALRYTVPQVQINPNWLSLLFAVLALAPREPGQQHDIASAEQYFSYAMAARRVAEGAYLVRPTATRASAAHGSVLGCLAVPLLCDHLAERGRVSEAWKLVGHAVLCAEAVGMHRDPGWRDWLKRMSSEDVMSDEEKLLRRRAWWGLFVWERMYGLILGRPTVIRSDGSDVVVPAPINADGTRNFFNVYQRLLIQLVHIAGETVEKCFAVGCPTSSAVHEMDRKLEQWEAHLPPEFRCDIRAEYQPGLSDDLDASDMVALARQRYTLSTWYHLCRMKLHLSFITSQDDSMFLGVWGSHGGNPMSRKRSRNLCISSASDLIRLQCDAHLTAARCRNNSNGINNGDENVLTGSNWCFAGCFSLFEAAVTLGSLLPPHSWHGGGMPGEPDSALVHQAMMVLGQVAEEEHDNIGSLARMGSEALDALIRGLDERTIKTESTSVGLQTTPTTPFNSFSASTPFMTNVAASTPNYEWYCAEDFTVSTEYAAVSQQQQTNDGKDGRFGMDLQLPMLMPFEDSKVGLLNCYDSTPRA